MALIVKDRVRETSTTTGTGTFTLAGAISGFQSFSVIGDGNTTYYTIVDAATGAWEVGIGTYTASGTTLSRDTVLESSSGGAKIDFAAGTKDVFCTYPAERSVYANEANTLVTVPALSTTSVTASAPSVISVNSSSDALRITQTGSGNALVVEDSANPDATPFLINNNGQLLNGFTTSQTLRNQGFAFSILKAQTIGGDGNNSSSGNILFNTGSSISPVFFLAKSNAATLGEQGLVYSSQNIGMLSFNASDGTGFIEAASISAAVDGTPGTNDMPGRLILATTRDGASSPTEAVRIDNQGRVGIGGTPTSGESLRLTRNVSGATTSYGVISGGVTQSDVTSNATYYGTSASTAAAAFTLSNLRHFNTFQGTIGATSAVTNQFGFFADATLTGATNNYGFFSNIPSGTGRWNFYAAGSAANYFAGNVGVGVVPESRLHISGNTTAVRIVSANNTTPQLTLERPGGTSYRVVNDAGAFKLQSAAASASPTFSTNVYHFETDNHLFFTSNTERVRISSAGGVGIGTIPSAGQVLSLSRNMTGATTAQGIVQSGTVLSDVTSTARYNQTFAAVTNAAFTLTTLEHYTAGQGTFGASATVSNQFGFVAGASLTGATNNYGFYSNIASGTGRWNFYAAGSAPNFFAGDVTINGVLTVANPVVQQSDIGTAPNEIPLNQYLGNLAYMSSDQIVINPAASAVPSGIGDMVFQLTSDTSLVVKVKGSDGTIRSATLTLA